MDNIKNILKELKIATRFSNQIVNAMESGIINLEEDKSITLKMTIDSSIAYELYCHDFIRDDSLREITFLDICHSTYRGGALRAAVNLSNRFTEKIEQDSFNVEDACDLEELICFLAVKINEAEFARYKSVEDIDKSVPLLLFINLYNKQVKKSEVIIEHQGNKIAGLLDKILIEKSMFGVTYTACVKFISKDNGKHYVIGKHYVEFQPKDNMVTTLEDVGINLITEEQKIEMSMRGKKYIKYTSSPSYCRYKGSAFTEGWMSDDRHTVDSRIMIDLKSMITLNPNVNYDWYWGGVMSNTETIGTTVSEDKHWMISPVVYGFSFGNKIWCRMNIDNVEDIEFSENAFRDLIIPEENKDLFISCMTNEMPSLDSIEGKGSGKIFLLYGPPGVGKTMTAEATAEHLKKPLYFVSVGELGTNPDALERSLDKVMKVANSWDAVILLDEVDVFAVKREGASIERNAMTAIFLRMLERYDGIMFMTTNLLDNLDSAFISRATAVIGYESLTAEDRANIWMKVLNKVESLNTISIDPKVYDNVAMLSTNELNGRVIKNTIRLAYTLAISKGKILKLEHIQTALGVRRGIKN